MEETVAFSSIRFSKLLQLQLVLLLALLVILVEEAGEISIRRRCVAEEDKVQVAGRELSVDNFGLTCGRLPSRLLQMQNSDNDNGGRI